ncbi:MAG: DNA-directed RNA polymerase subunit alpha C-terminal domain-containing protein [bacterium]
MIRRSPESAIANNKAPRCRCGKRSHPQYGSKCEDCWVEVVSHSAPYPKTDNEKDEPLEDLLFEPPSELGLSTRASNHLERMGVTSIGELVKKTKEQLSMIRGLGDGTIEEIVSKLEEIGLKLAEE